ncbi:MAG: WecB/TagA/CpsF family glycosyltransferase [Winogradskyella sp.]
MDKKSSIKKIKQPWPTKDAMTQIYEMKLWGGQDFDFYSGDGSHNHEIVKPYLNAVSSFLKSFKKPLTVCDLGCGDFNIGKEFVKIPGCELWLDLVKRYHKTKTFYLVGGQQEVIEETVEKLQTDFPGMRIVNFRNGYIQTEEEKQALIADIVEKQPEVVFVAMGSPKQELLMEAIQQQHQATFQGLGGSFDVYTGHVQRAPQWWVNNQLEWAYRLIKQPSRIKRQIHLLRFFVNLQLKRY